MTDILLVLIWVQTVCKIYQQTTNATASKEGVRRQLDRLVFIVGVAPATDFLKGSGINMTDRGFIPVNEVHQVANETKLCIRGTGLYGL